MTINTNLFIRIIEYAVDTKKGEPFPFSELFSDLALEDPITITQICELVERKELLSHQGVRSRFFNTSGVGTPSDVKVWCSAKEQFRFLQYQAYQQANRDSVRANQRAERAENNAKKANEQARNAFLVTCVALIFSIFMGVSQFYSDVNFPERYYSQQEKFYEMIEDIFKEIHYSKVHGNNISNTLKSISTRQDRIANNTDQLLIKANKLESSPKLPSSAQQPEASKKKNLKSDNMHK